MSQKPRMPKKFRRQIKKDKKKKTIKELDEFFAAMKERMMKGEKITEKDFEDLNDIAE